MAECTQDEELDETPGYKAPAQKSLDEILNQDVEDESLRKYKEKLLGNAENLETIGDPSKPYVEMKSMTFTMGEKVLGEITDFGTDKANNKVEIPEGAEYKICFRFIVRNQIVSGLVLKSKFSKLKFKLNEHKIIGSYGPKKEEYEYREERKAPSGLGATGCVTIKSELTDDDKAKYFSWTWVIDIKKKDKKAK